MKLCFHATTHNVTLFLETTTYSTPHKKSVPKDHIPLASPSVSSTLNKSKGHRTLIERFKHFMKSTKKKKLSFNVELTDGSNLEDSMLCGNKSVSLNQTLSPSIAENFLCCVCHGVPTETPLVSICCEAIYCSECFHSWKQISNTCFRSCYGECNKLLSKQGAKQIEGFYQKVWSQLMTICNVCGNKIELSETLFHDFKCQKR